MREYLVARRYRIEMLRKAMTQAAVASVLSDVAREAARRYLQVDPIVLPGGVRVADFAVDFPRFDQPTLFCASSVGDPRKRGALLVEAFARVRAEVPEAELLLARTPDPFMSPEEHELPEGARWVDVTGTDDLARLYAGSWATVLPAIWEPFGLVLVESLASGTPVVAARSGACPEIVDRPQVGWLFEEDDAGSLADSMKQALSRPPSRKAAEACRARGRDFDWDRVADLYEDAYGHALGRG
jgi:glycosyltransferase involved in cell wall biosynthesis